MVTKDRVYDVEQVTLRFSDPIRMLQALDYFTMMLTKGHDMTRTFEAVEDVFHQDCVAEFNR